MDPHVSIQTTGSGVEGTSKRCTCIYIYLIRKASCAVQIIYLAVENYNIYQEIGGKILSKHHIISFQLLPKPPLIQKVNRTPSGPQLPPICMMYSS